MSKDSDPKHGRAKDRVCYILRGPKSMGLPNFLGKERALVKEHNPSFTVHLYFCLTVQVENLHAVGHFKDQFPTLLQYARNLANTVYESIKHVVPWSAYYFTDDKSSCAKPRHSTKCHSKAGAS